MCRAVQKEDALLAACATLIGRSVLHFLPSTLWRLLGSRVAPHAKEAKNCSCGLLERIPNPWPRCG